MSSNKTRTRSQVTPFPFGTALPVVLGYRQNYNPTTKIWGTKTFTNSSIGALGYPAGVKAKITQDEVHSGPPYRSGGPFRSLRIETCLPFQVVQGFGTYYRLDGLQRYVGGFEMPSQTEWGAGMVVGPYNSTLSLSSSEFPALGDWGDKAFNKAKPKLEKASGFVALAEAKDIPRMLKTTSGSFHDLWTSVGGSSTGPSMAPKKAADHFLNHQFGWVPFLSDIGRFIDTFQHSYHYINNLADRNGKWIRKRVTLKEESTSQLVASGFGTQLFPNASFDSPFTPWFSPGRPATWELFEEVNHFITASGKFRFYRPEFDRSRPDYYSAMNAVGRQMTIYGLRASPANIYKATPWSWAIDWISNAGDYVSRANDMLIDGVAAQYLYVMQHKLRVRRYIQYLPFSTGTVKLEFTRIIETKQRDAGLSPYGFSLSLANLTPRQIAIAGALGISRT